MRMIVVWLILLISTRVSAHGEDKPGPNGGFISMPGPYHVEVVPLQERKVKVFLLDMAFGKPTVAESSVQVKLAAISAKCSPRVDHFTCEFPEGTNLNRPGELTVESVRDRAKGNAVNYRLPLRIKAKH